MFNLGHFFATLPAPSRQEKPMSLTRLLILFISVALLGNTLAQASTSEKTRYQFTLQSAQGAVSDTDFAKQHILLTFGYTSCPDICPTILYDLKQVMTMLDHPDKLQVIFISIDPEADTPERLAQYVQFFDKTFYWTYRRLRPTENTGPCLRRHLRLSSCRARHRTPEPACGPYRLPLKPALSALADT